MWLQEKNTTMKSFIVVLAFVAVAFANDQIDSDWDQWKAIHKKSYSIAEESLRKNIFTANAERIASHNRLFDLGLQSHRLGVNKFADLTHEEFTKIYLGGTPPKRQGKLFTPHKNSGLARPDSIDWRTKNAVTDVKNQGNGGSCWVFSAIGSLEGLHAIASGSLVSLSEQQVIDCANITALCDNQLQGCEGGWANASFQYIQTCGGIENDSDYPASAQAEACNFDATKVAATVTGFVNIVEGSEDDLQDAVANNGPIAVAIEVKYDFEYYSGGVYMGPNCEGTVDALSHGLVIVGYGTDNGQDYYIGKNSWGASWGEQGYVRMARNDDDKCGIALAASYPTVQ